MYYNKLGILDSVLSKYERYNILFTSFLLYVHFTVFISWHTIDNYKLILIHSLHNLWDFANLFTFFTLL